jgi:HlyD family secretion protein
MTATAEIVTATRENVLLVPNAALRFVPPAKANAGNNKGKSLVGSLIPHPPSTPRRTAAAAPSKDQREQQLWVLRDGTPMAIRVVTGATNGRLTEISDGELDAGTKVITESLGSRS